ncbi:zinc finger MYND domain-containing protein [Phanerochaete sordida]|uniref:Zinc finger MYND domain-containing protein n=1 Tax=Phanerochaete sordida TaxID=48140 RepID=A0A9P3GFW6_9APHY|nr:zinc finger MYND domain-containing protein [Phanerochaete sordida]
MLGLRKEILEGPSFAPRPYLEGLKLPASFQLPQMHMVAEDIVKMRKIQREGGPEPINAVFMTSGGPKGAKEEMIEPLRYNVLLPHLFKFAYFVHVADVPDAMLEDIVFTLEQFIRVLSECSERQLRAIGHVLPNQTLETAQYFMLSNSRYKLAVHLLNPKIHRPADAAKHLKDQIDADMPRLEGKKAWAYNPHQYTMYAEALYLSGQYKEMKEVCENILQDAGDSELADLREPIFMSRLMLSYALLRLGIEPEAQKEHTEWTVKMIKKAPNRYPKEILGQYLDTQDGPAHPVLTALGGERWLEKGKTSTTLRQDERATKQCRTCGVTDMQKTLSRCARCQHIYYCSKECQKANWKAHKEQCTDVAKSRARVEKLKSEGSSVAQKEADWVEWRNLSHYANTFGLQHALNLNRDPARGRTHIVVRQVKHAPDEPDLRHRFTITHAGVFKLADCWDALDDVLGGRGEGKAMVADIMNDIDSTSASRGADAVPMLDLTLGDGVQPWLGSMATTRDGLRHRPYDPDWRKSMNKKGTTPPDRILKFKNAEDAEFKFD